MVLRKTILLTFIVPGAVTILVPYWLLPSLCPAASAASHVSQFGVLPILFGLAI
jgi:hypothetical protein